VKETGEIEQKPSTFVQFSREEIYGLLRTLLAAGARGESIRGASLKLAGGDKTLMLRYQNKYRSLIKSARPLVEVVMADMDQDGDKYLSPYETQKTSAVRENRYIPESVARALSGADIDVKAFFKGLAKIASLAASSMQAEQELLRIEAQTETIRKENATLSANVRDLSAKLKKEMERSVKAATLYQQLMKMNASPELKNMDSLAGLGELLGAHTSADAL